MSNVIALCGAFQPSCGHCNLWGYSVAIYTVHLAMLLDLLEPQGPTSFKISSTWPSSYSVILNIMCIRKKNFEELASYSATSESH